MEEVFQQQHARLTAFITETSEQRYLKLLANKPNILQRVALYDIASYIGITPESLSRLRRKLAGQV
jgi:CRP-like cAMP-binding protein